MPYPSSSTAAPDPIIVDTYRVKRLMERTLFPVISDTKSTRSDECSERAEGLLNVALRPTASMLGDMAPEPARVDTARLRTERVRMT